MVDEVIRWPCSALRLGQHREPVMSNMKCQRGQLDPIQSVGSAGSMESANSGRLYRDKGKRLLVSRVIWGYRLFSVSVGERNGSVDS